MAHILILLSDSTKKKLGTLRDNSLNLYPAYGFGDVISLEDLLLLLKVNHKNTNDNHFNMISLQHSLLHDLSNHLNQPSVSPKKNKSKKGWAHIQLLFLAICGIILFGCEGFDSIFAILGIFSLPSVIILGAGIVFSLLSISVFLGFELMEISKNLGVSVRNASSILDGYVQELETISLLHKQLLRLMADDPNDNEHLLDVAQMLTLRLERLKEVGDKFERAVNHPALKVARFAMAAFAGCMFFGGGFFAGQTVALAVLSVLGIAAGPAFWPVVVVSVLVGLAGLSVYWFVERPGLQNLIGKWLGLDRDKINQISDHDTIDTLKEEINHTKRIIIHMQPANIREEQPSSAPLISDYADLQHRAKVERDDAPTMRAI